jgi:hypothetical protein
MPVISTELKRRLFAKVAWKRSTDTVVAFLNNWVKDNPFAFMALFIFFKVHSNDVDTPLLGFWRFPPIVRGGCAPAVLRFTDCCEVCALISPLLWLVNPQVGAWQLPFAHDVVL